MTHGSAFRRRPTDADLEEAARLVEQLTAAMTDPPQRELAQLLATPATMADGRRRPLGKWELDDFADLHDELRARGLPLWGRLSQASTEP